MGHHLVAARRTGGQHDHRRAAHGLQAGGPGRTGVRRVRVAGQRVHRAYAVRRERGDQLVGRRADDDRVDRHTSTGLGEGAGEGQRLARHLDRLARGRGLHQDDDHRASTPSCSSRSTTAGAASAPLPRIRTSDGVGGGSSSRTRPGPTGARRGLTLLDRDLLGLHPTRDGGVARLDAALEDGDDRGQRHPVGLVPVGSGSVGGDRPIGDRDLGDPVDHRPAELVGEPDADLEVAAVGGVVAEQHQVVIGRDHGDLARHVRRAEGLRVGHDVHGRGAADGQRRAQLLGRVGVAEGEDGRRTRRSPRRSGPRARPHTPRGRSS